MAFEDVVFIRDNSQAENILKIVYLHQYFNTPAMSGGTRSFEMARRLVAAGHEVNLVTSRREAGTGANTWEVTEEAGIKVYWYPVPYSNQMGFFERISAFLRFAAAAAHRAASFEGDVVFATSTPLTIVLPGLFAAWRLRVPLVFEVRDMWPAVPIAMGYLNNPLLRMGARWLERLAYRSSCQVVALAPGMRDDIIATGISPEKVTVIPNGCDTDIFGAELSAEVADLRATHPWLQQRKLVLFAGTLGRANGVGFLVQLAVEMRSIDTEVRFLVIGDGAERDQIADAAQTAGVLDTSFFMLQAMPKTELAVWVAASDFTVGLFSGPRVLWKDAVQNKFFDSLSAGKPVACNFVGFQSELAVEHGVGLILPPENPQEAARQLHYKLHDAAWNAAAASRARELAHHDFSRDRLAGQLESVLLVALGPDRT
jgi:glycosyltransferase involved in cell wall biosynthesis